jgi:peptidyl-prolyl cis-trans isomerase SurA
MHPVRFMLAAALAAMIQATPAALSPVEAAEQGLVAIVNDQPITETDITQRIALLKVLGDLPEGMTRQKALRDLIDDQVKITEATRLKLMPSDAEITDRINRMSKNMKSTTPELLAKLKAQGIGEAAFRRYIGASTGFSRIISGKYREDVKVSPADVDAKYAEIKQAANSQMAKIMNDPRMKPITVYSLMEISLPVEANDSMLLQSRALEAQQYIQRFKGCGSARAAAEGIFNVKIGKKFDADASKLPKPVRAALQKAGEGKAVGPMRGKGSIQLLAFCGSRTLTPPKPDFKLPTREQVERGLLNQKYDTIEENYLKSIRDNVYIEYRSSKYAQQ